MMDKNYEPPAFEKKAFHCPHCGAYTQQNWINDRAILGMAFGWINEGYLSRRENIHNYTKTIQDFLDVTKEIFSSTYDVWRNQYSNQQYCLASCHICKKFSVWIDEKMVYPPTPTSPPPHEDMPPNVKKTYEEAQRVQPFSARASAVLLRVALEQLTGYLEETEKTEKTKGNLYTRIGNLKKGGLPGEVIDCLDIVRIYADAGAHAAREIDLGNEDNEEVVNKLFMLVNIIVEKKISGKKQIKALKEGLPENKKEAIKNRDSNN